MDGRDVVLGVDVDGGVVPPAYDVIHPVVAKVQLVREHVQVHVGLPLVGPDLQDCLPLRDGHGQHGDDGVRCGGAVKRIGVVQKKLSVIRLKSVSNDVVENLVYGSAAM